MANSFKDKVIVITGGASGIAKATAEECASRGASLALGDINVDALGTVVADLQSRYPDLKVFHGRLDVSDSASVNTFFDLVLQHFSRIDGAANIAGVEGKPGLHPFVSIADMTDEHWQFVHDVNLNGVFYCLRAELKAMKHGGSVVNMASTAGLRSAPQFSAYCSSKHAVVGLTKSAAKEVGDKGIRVNAVCPGPINTHLMQRIIDNAPGLMDRMTSNAAIKRMGETHEVAKTVCYLLSEDSSWVTGTTLTIDGGAG